MESIPLPLQIYLTIYSLLVLAAFILMFKCRHTHNFLTKEYAGFIFTPKRFLIYLLGTLALVLPVQILNYHSWDYPIAFFQPLLAYLTAPWATAIFGKMEKGLATTSEAFVALCMMLFTGSWSVEIYLLYRDGYYMPDWLINIPIGIVCYIGIGLLWNIPWYENEKHPVLKE